MAGRNGELPEGWVAAEFGELVSLAQNGLSARHGVGEPTVVLRLADVNVLAGSVASESLRSIGLAHGQREKYALAVSDLLAIRVNGSPHLAGALLRFPGPAGWAYCDHFIRFRVHAGIDPQYVASAFRHRPVRRQVEANMVSSAGQHTVSQRTYARVLLPLAPAREQQRIVAEIEKHFTRLDEAVATLKAVQAKLRRARASVLKAAVEGRLVPTEAELARAEGRSYEAASVLLERILAERRARWSKSKKYQPPAEPKIDDQPEPPEGWAWATLDQLCPVFVDCPHRTPPYSAEGLPALRPRDVVGGRLELSTAARVTEDEFRLQVSRRVPEAGDIIYSRELSLGWGIEVPDGVRVCMSQGMVLFRPDAGVSRHYVLVLLNGAPGRQQAEKASTGSAHPHLNLGHLKAFVFPLPPKPEQARIAAEVERRLSVIDNLERTVEQTLARCARLRQSILKRAFEGKLVPQDPADEPASELLARIRAHRAAEARA